MKLIIAVVVIAILALLTAVCGSLFRKRPGNVVSFGKGRKKRPAEGQMCSRCKRRGRLVFYANDAGVVRGLCKECKQAAEKHEELYPV